MRRGQTATEYLIILSIVILITFLVITILGDTTGINDRSSTRTELLDLASQKIGIMGFSVSDYDTTLTLRNSQSYPLQIDRVSINGNECIFLYGKKPNLGVNEVQEVSCQGLTGLTEEEFTWEINITWRDVLTGAVYEQTGLDLIGKVGSEYMDTVSLNRYWNGVNGCFDAGVDPIPICTCLDLNRTKEDLTANYELQNSIDFVRCNELYGADFITHPGWGRIGTASGVNAYSGTFDGGGFIIKNLFMNYTATQYVGLFGYTNGASILNLGVVEANVTAHASVAPIIGFAGGTTYLTDSFATGFVTGNISSGFAVGGLIGYGTDAVVEGSFSDVVAYGRDVGGVLGFGYYPTIINSYAVGSVEATGSTGGGLIGYTNGATVTNSYSDSPVICSGTCVNIGGLIGWDAGSPICSGIITWVNYSYDDAVQCIGNGASCTGCTSN